jgi:formamidopyrimidine-DNA glycosylase
MPEGPEVLNYFKFISPILENKIIENLQIISSKYTRKGIPNIEKVKDLYIKDTLVKGKTIFIKCENNITLVFVHGMTGCYSIEKEKHSRIEINFKNKDKLYYNDMRNFGTLNIYTTVNDFEKSWNSLGPDILNTEVNYEEFYSRLLKYPNMKIGIALLEQKLLAGIGNYLRCDILWYSKINYERTIRTLTEEEKLILYDASINIIRFHANMSYNLKYLPKNEFFVYQQKYDIFNNKVIRKEFNNRTIHFVDWFYEDDDDVIIIIKKKI